MKYIGYMYPGGVCRIHVFMWSIQDTCIQVGFQDTSIQVEYIGYMYPGGVYNTCI